MVKTNGNGSGASRRLIQELHDGVAQDLWYLAFEISSLNETLPPGPSALKEEMRELEGVAWRSYQQIRASLNSGSSHRGPPVNLLKALCEHVASCARMTPGMGVVVTGDDAGAGVAVSPSVRHNVTSIVREALWNAWRHGQAPRVDITVQVEAATLVVTASDNGQGFDPAVSKEGHYGLRIMRERAESLGGRLVVRSAPGQGAQVLLYLPQVKSPRRRAPGHGKSGLEAAND